MKITTNGVTVRSGGVKYPPGSTIDIDDDAAAGLIARGCATEVPEEAMSPAISGTGAGDLQPEARPKQIQTPTKPKRGKS